jgi:TonB family protein
MSKPETTKLETKLKMKLQEPVATNLLRRVMIACATAILVIACCAKPALSETKDGTSDRRVVTQIEPEYPETLKRLYIGGLVRMEVVVDPNGKVETVTLLGGNPVLGQSAMKAVKQWKYAPSDAKEKFVVQLAFDPHR